MKYVSGIHALNLPCSLETTGDWHQSALRWENITFGDSEQSIFGDFGLEYDKHIPNHVGTFVVADHLRALLDLLDWGMFTIAQGMRNDFICTDKYNDLFFGKVMLLRRNDNWQDIDKFMSKEYMFAWERFKKSFDNIGGHDE